MISEMSFLAACQSCSRKAAKHLAKDTHPLKDASLQAFARQALRNAIGNPVDNSTPFHLTIWPHGATHVGKKVPGTQFNETVGRFVQILEQRAQVVVDKKQGWVVEPTTNPEGRRTNECTLAMHALFLDCDAAGEWDTLLLVLSEIGLSHIAYQSSGWTPSAPKWRVVLPLAAPFPTPDDTSRALWKTIYLACRILLGSLGQLSGVGFDPNTDGVAIPWFLLEKKSSDTPPRKVVFQPGASLDLVKLAMTLPEFEEKDDHKNLDLRAPVARIPLVEGRLEEIVSALIPVTSEVHNHRRELYLALPGALLDRGVTPEDVVEICEAVSGAYKGGDSDKHADNVRSAKCTVAAWEKTGIVTRIGTLQGTWPDVAKAVDEVLPDPFAQMLLVRNQQVLQNAGISPASEPTPPSPPASNTTDWTDALVAQKNVELSALRKRVVQLRRKKRTLAKKASEKIGAGDERKKYDTDATLLDNILEERPIHAGTDMGRGKAIRHAAGLLAFCLPRNAPIENVRQIMRAAVFAARGEESAESLLNEAEACFKSALKRRVELVDARNAELIARDRQGL